MKALSPNVEQHRKGRGPKRERSSTHWDTDILLPKKYSGIWRDVEKGDG